MASDTFVHVAQEDTDIVRCSYNNWNEMVNKERGRLQNERMKKYTRNGMVCIDRTFKNVTNKEAEQAFTAEDKQKNNETCNQVFVQKAAADSTMKTLRDNVRYGNYKYKCGACYGALLDDANVWMCPQHTHHAICSLCHGYRAEMQIYARITSKLDNSRGSYIDPDDTAALASRDKKRQDEREELRQSVDLSMDKVQKIASNTLSHVINHFNNRQATAKEIGDIIVDFLGKNAILRFAGNDELKALFDMNWRYEMKSFAPNKWGWYGSPRLRVLNMKMNEYEEIQKDAMYQKYVIPNRKVIDFEAFKRLDVVGKMIYKNDSFDPLEDESEVSHLLDVLCDDNFNSFYGVVMKLKDYSYAGHPYYPGGPPQTCGTGECILYAIGDVFYCLWSYKQHSVGM